VSAAWDLPHRLLNPGKYGIERVVADPPEAAVVKVTSCVVLRRLTAGRRRGRRRRSGCPTRRRARSRSTPSEIARAFAPSGSLKAGHQPRSGARTEPEVTRRLGRRELHHAQAVDSVGQVGKLADVRDPQLHVVQVVDAAARIVDLVDFWARPAAQCRGPPSRLARRPRRRMCVRDRWTERRASAASIPAGDAPGP